MPKLSLRERFERHVDRSAGPKACHPWIGGTYKDRGGRRRGKMRVGVRTITAARVALALRLGVETDEGVCAMPPSIEAAHECDNGICCNEQYINPQSHSENLNDYFAKYGNPRERAAA